MGILIVLGWTEEVQEVKNGIRHHFESSFKEHNFHRPNLGGVEFNILSLEERLSLEIPFEEEEVKTMVWQSANDESPGPDGFNMNFYKACWDILKGDIMKFFQFFFSCTKLRKAITASFITIIPKYENP